MLMVSNNSRRTGCIYPFNPSLKERPMRRAIEVSLLVLAFSTLNVGLSVTGFAQDEAGQENVIKKSVDLVSLYFSVRDNRKKIASKLDQGDFTVLEDGK